MAQIIKEFERKLIRTGSMYDRFEPLEEQIQTYISQNPTHFIKCIAPYTSVTSEKVLVVFDVREPNERRNRN